MEDQETIRKKWLSRCLEGEAAQMRVEKERPNTNSLARQRLQIARDVTLDATVNNGLDNGLRATRDDGVLEGRLQSPEMRRYVFQREVGARRWRRLRGRNHVELIVTPKTY
jgi:hypothetical protein